MKFENAFEVDAPVDQVWDTVLDVERVAPTVPGAKVLEQTGDNAYKVGIKVKLGPMTMTYKGDIEVVEADEKAHRAVMKARAKEARGQGTADADVTMELTGDGGHTTGKIVTDIKVSGKAASMGRGVMQDVAGKMVGTFAENLAKMLEGDEKAPSIGTEARPGTPEGEAPEGAAAASGEATSSGEAAPSENGGPSAEQRAAASATGAASGASPSGGASASDDQEALDLGELGGQVLLARLRDPKVIAGLVLLLLVLRRLFR